MPRIEISKLPNIALDFLVHIVWPNDEEKRKAYIALGTESSIAYFAEAQAASPLRNAFADGHYDVFSKTIRDLFAADWRDPDETARVISKGFGIASMDKEIKSNLEKAFLAGITLLAFTAMIEHHSEDDRLRGGPGIKKAQEVIARATLKALSSVESAWSTYKSISHYCAAATVLTDSGVNGMTCKLAQPDAELIAISQYYLALLTTYKPSGRQEPLVATDRMWLPPQNMDFDAIRVPGKPLPEPFLDDLDGRKAR